MGYRAMVEEQNRAALQSRRFWLETKISRKRSFLVLLLAGGHLSACNLGDKMADAFQVDPFTTRAQKEEDAKAKGGSFAVVDGAGRPTGVIVVYPFDLDKGTLPEQPPEYSTAYAFAVADNTGKNRNRFADYLMKISDDACNQHKVRIIASSSGVNFSLSQLTSVFGGLGAILTGTTATRVFSGAAGLTNATRDNIGEHFYQKMLATALIKQVDRQRDDKNQKVNARRTEDLSTYTVEAMLRDMTEYHELCSFYAALVGLTDPGATSPPSAPELQARIKSLQDEIKENTSRMNELAPRVAADRGAELQYQQLEAGNVEIQRAIRILQTRLSFVRSGVASTSDQKDKK